MRPSVGCTPMDGIVEWSQYVWTLAHTCPHVYIQRSRVDTFGYLTRDMDIFMTVARAVHTPKLLERKVLFQIARKPMKLLYPTEYWPVDDPDLQAQYEAFITQLEKYLGIARSPISLEQLWNDHNPVNTTQSLEEYFFTTFPQMTGRDQWLATLKPFSDQYQQAFGRPPVVNPQLQFRM